MPQGLGDGLLGLGFEVGKEAEGMGGLGWRQRGFLEHLLNVGPFASLILSPQLKR